MRSRSVFMLSWRPRVSFGHGRENLRGHRGRAVDTGRGDLEAGGGTRRAIGDGPRPRPRVGLGRRGWLGAAGAARRRLDDARVDRRPAGDVRRADGDSWTFATAGLHAHYLRAVTVAGDQALVSASTGFRGRRSAIYRTPLDGETRFERCRAGLPAWFDDNVDTACLAAAGPLVVFGTGDGRVYRSLDAGARWALALKGLPPVGCVAVG